MYRILARSEEGIELVREYTPCRRTIKFNNDYYTLQFPYVIFLNKGFNTFVAFSPKPIEHKLDSVYMPPIGNIYECWNICGCETDISKCALLSRTNRLEYCIKLFWQSKFTLDGIGHILLRQIFGSHSEWSKKTLSQVLELIQYPDAKNGILETYNEYSSSLAIMRTFENFLDSDRRFLLKYESYYQMLPIHKITLDSKYEQTIQIPTNLSFTVEFGNN